jgi:hypothetical protein
VRVLGLEFDQRGDVTATKTIEQLLQAYLGEVRAVFSGARELIRRLLPNVEETVDGSAPVVGYGFGPGYRGVVCTLILSSSGVKLGPVRGGELADPRGLLEGSGNVHRYVPLRRPPDLRKAGWSGLVKAAYAAWRGNGTRRKGNRHAEPNGGAEMPSPRRYSQGMELIFEFATGRRVATARVRWVMPSSRKRRPGKNFAPTFSKQRLFISKMPRSSLGLCSCTKGSHVMLRHAGPPVQTITVPLHNPLKTGTLHGVLAEVAAVRRISIESIAESL